MIIPWRSCQSLFIYDNYEMKWWIKYYPFPFGSGQTYINVLCIQLIGENILNCVPFLF